MHHQQSRFPTAHTGYHPQPRYNSNKTGYDYNGGANLVVGSPCWPSPNTGGTMDDIKAWLDKPTLASHPTILNKHVVIVGGVVAAAGLAWYGHSHRWF